MNCQTQGSRRRGAELEDALLQAAWDELVAVGYPALTMEGVAARAGTSRAVLYRRWSNRPELVTAALRRHGAAGPPTVPDTGNVRDDMLAQVRYMCSRMGEVVGLCTLLLNDFYEAGGSLSELRDRALAPEVAVLDAVLDAAEERGELKPGVRHSRIATVAVDLVRMEVISRGGAAPPDEVLVDIVDNIWLPLARR